MKLSLVLLSLLLIVPSTKAYSQTVVGWLETVSILSGSEQHSIQAKIDSGADHSSIHATNIKVFTFQDQDWVTFSTINNLVLQMPLHRYTKVKTKNHTLQTRPVVLMLLCLDGKKRTIEVNLVNRKHFSRGLLVGRSALSGFLIDPQKTDLISPESCQNKT